MIKKILNEYAVCCKDTKWKVMSGFIGLILVFCIGYNVANIFEKESHAAYKEKIILQQEEVKKLQYNLDKAIKNLNQKYRQETTASEMFRYRIIKEVRDDCEKEIKKIKDAYKKASCSICKEKKDK